MISEVSGKAAQIDQLDAQEIERIDQLDAQEIERLVLASRGEIQRLFDENEMRPLKSTNWTPSRTLSASA